MLTLVTSKDFFKTNRFTFKYVFNALSYILSWSPKVRALACISAIVMLSSSPIPEWVYQAIDNRKSCQFMRHTCEQQKIGNWIQYSSTLTSLTWHIFTSVGVKYTCKKSVVISITIDTLLSQKIFGRREYTTHFRVVRITIYIIFCILCFTCLADDGPPLYNNLIGSSKRCT